MGFWGAQKAQTPFFWEKKGLEKICFKGFLGGGKKKSEGKWKKKVFFVVFLGAPITWVKKKPQKSQNLPPPFSLGECGPTKPRIWKKIENFPPGP